MSNDEPALLIARDRAAKAASLLENPLLVEIFDGLEADLVEGWKNSPPNDAAARERAWMAVGVLRNVRSILEKAVHFDGKFAERVLDELHPNKVRA